MPRLYISEYSPTRPMSLDLSLPLAHEPADVEQPPVQITTSSAQSATFAASTRMVRVHTDAACNIAVGVNPVAAAGSKRLAADTTEYFYVTPGHKVAVIAYA